MTPFRRLESRTVVIPRADIDTDQIIPARFLKGIGRAGLGQHLFAEWRALADFPLDRPESRGAQVLVAGPNFGCGSSREHAPWALTDYGFRAVISTEIADIFSSNALKNGLLPVIVDEAVGSWLIAHPGEELTLDVAARTLTLPDRTVVSFPLEAFARHCLLRGLDELAFLLERRGEIEAYERRA